MKVALLIPAYDPETTLSSFVSELIGAGFEKIVVVNDGSSKTCDDIFEDLKRRPQVTVLDHAVNLGKGAALKTGLNFSYCSFPELDGVITADADGQHLTADILALRKLAEVHSEDLVMGSREFDRNIPLRSSFGNAVSKYVFRFITGIKLSDTQCGLRYIPKRFIPELLRTTSGGYEFEMEMLLKTKSGGLAIIECPINTVYIDSNRSSHFNPVIDSFKIYFVLLRFLFASLATVLVDYLAFILSYQFLSSILACVYIARFFAIGVNFFLVKSFVFRYRGSFAKGLARYLALVIFMALIAYSMIELLVAKVGMNVLLAKMLVECSMFLANFAIQRNFVFPESPNGR